MSQKNVIVKKQHKIHFALHFNIFEITCLSLFEVTAPWIAQYILANIQVCKLLRMCSIWMKLTL